MKKHANLFQSGRGGRFAAALALLGAAAVTAPAAVLTWQGGDGTWNTTDSNWRNGTSTALWTDSTSGANFAGTAGTVTIGAGGVTATSLSFNTTGYELVGTDTLSIVAGVPSITVASGVTATISGPISITGTTTTLGALSGGGTLVLNGPLSGTSANGNYFFVLNAGNTLTLAGNNTYAKTLWVKGGVLNINNVHALGNNATLLINTATLNNTSGGDITMSTTNSYEVRSGNLTFQGTNNLNLGMGGFQITQTSASTLTVVSNTLTIGGVFAGSSTVTFVKAGAGTVQLTNNNSYTGSTVINAGTLLVSGSGGVNTTAGSILVDGASAVFKYTSTRALTKAVTFGASGGAFIYDSTTAYAQALTVASGGTLSGTGKLTGPVTISSGATLSPGNSPGIISTGTLTVDGTLKAEINGTTVGTQYDQVAVTGDVTLNGSTSDLNFLLGYAPVTNDSYTIISNDGTDAVSGTFATVNGGSFTAGNMFDATYNSTLYHFQVNYAGGDGNDVVITAVPEPTALALMALAGLAVLGRRRTGDRR